MLNDYSLTHRGSFNWNGSTFLETTHQMAVGCAASHPIFFSSFNPPTAINPFNHFSQGQVPLLLDIFENKTNGIFIDLATYEWKQGSNTWPLEYFFNWSGICVEPNSNYFRGILENRKCTLVTNPVYSVSNRQIQFHLAGGLGGIVEAGMDNARARRHVKTMVTTTLSDILEHIVPPPNKKTGTIDYLSLDVEGGEYQVLSQFNFTKWSFKVLTIERPNDALHALLIKHGYWWLCQVIPPIGRPHGEMIYLHYNIPLFSILMNKYRTNTLVTYVNNRHLKNSTFLLRPQWPPTGDKSFTANEYLSTGDVVKCVNDRSIYAVCNKTLNWMSMDNLLAAEVDFNNVITLSAELCSSVKIGPSLKLRKSHKEIC